MRKFDPDDSRPPYQQLAEALRLDIEDGSIKPGEQLPSYGEMAAEHGVSIGVVKRALTSLRDANLVVTRHGQGSFVRTVRDADAVPSVAELAATVKAMAARLDALERRLSAP